MSDDIAFINATKRLEQISAERLAYELQISALRDEEEKIRSFLNLWSEFANLTDHTKPIQAPTMPESPPDPRPVNPPREEIGDAVQVLLEARGAPISRNALFKALIADGIELKGKEPEMVLSTMLWRMKDRFVRLKGHGYWLANKPFVQAGYDPNGELGLEQDPGF